MKRLGDRIFIFFLVLLMIIGLSGMTRSVSAENENGSSTPVTETEDATSSDTGKQGLTYPEQDIKTAAEPTGKCYVSSARIKEKVDGTEPFDSDDDAGNDSNAKNDIVRSFDSIYYTLECVTAINTDDPIDKTNLMIEVTLPVDKSVAHFNRSSNRQSYWHWYHSRRTDWNRWISNRTSKEKKITHIRLPVSKENNIKPAIFAF